MRVLTELRNEGDYLRRDARPNVPPLRHAKIAFVLTQCTHYTQGLFEILATKFGAEFFFFSDGQDWYWEQRNGSRAGCFEHEYLSGFRLGGARITPALPHRLLQKDFDAIVAAIDGRFSLPIALACARLKKIPFVLWTGIWHRIDTPFHRAILPITKRVYRCADGLVVYGDHVKRYLETEGVSGDRIFPTAHAVDNAACSRTVTHQEIAQLKRQLQVRESSSFLLFVGRLEEAKGVSYLLEAMSKINDHEVILVIVGDGSQKEILKRQTQRLGLHERVRFAGYIPTVQTCVFYAAALALVVPSITTKREKEPWGLVINEAMNQRLPVVATDAVGAVAGALVLDGVNGLVVPEKDAAALANAMNQLVADPSLRNKMGKAGGSIIVDWGHQQMATGFEQCLTWVLRKRSPEMLNQKPTIVRAEAGDLS